MSRKRFLRAYGKAVAIFLILVVTTGTVLLGMGHNSLTTNEAIRISLQVGGVLVTLGIVVLAYLAMDQSDRHLQWQLAPEWYAAKQVYSAADALDIGEEGEPSTLDLKLKNVGGGAAIKPSVTYDSDRIIHSNEMPPEGTEGYKVIGVGEWYEVQFGWRGEEEFRTELTIECESRLRAKVRTRLLVKVEEVTDGEYEAQLTYLDTDLGST